jgi:hypothetical protein
MITLIFDPDVIAAVDRLGKKDRARYRKLLKAFSQLETDPTYPKLRSRPVQGASPTDWGKPVWFADVENNTPAAWRMIWAYGPGAHQISVLWVGPHP